MIARDEVTELTSNLNLSLRVSVERAVNLYARKGQCTLAEAC